MYFLKVLPAAIVAILAIIQSTWPDNPSIKSKRFKYSFVILAIITALLTIYFERENEIESQHLNEALEGISATVFQKDIDFVLQCSLSTPTSPKKEPIWIRVYVIPNDSPFFGKWGITMTCNLVGLGKFYDLKSVPLEDDLFGAQGVDEYIFTCTSPSERNTFRLETGQPVKIASRSRTLNEFLECQFFCIIETETKIKNISIAELKLKGQPVPFNMISSSTGKSFHGITVFRPIFERSKSLKSLYPPE